MSNNIDESHHLHLHVASLSDHSRARNDGMSDSDIAQAIAMMQMAATFGKAQQCFASSTHEIYNRTRNETIVVILSWILGYPEGHHFCLSRNIRSAHFLSLLFRY